MSAVKSESTDDDNKSASTSAGLSNEVVTVSASGSNIEEILMNIDHRMQPNGGNKYRKRKTPEAEADNRSSSSMDSDDWTLVETPLQPDISVLQADNADLQRLIDLCGSDTDSDPARRSPRTK